MHLRDKHVGLQRNYTESDYRPDLDPDEKQEGTKMSKLNPFRI